MSKSFIVTDDEMKPDSCYECGAEQKWLVLKHGETADHDAWWECVVCEHKFPVVRLFDISEEEPPNFEGDDSQEAQVKCPDCGGQLEITDVHYDGDSLSPIANWTCKSCGESFTDPTNNDGVEEWESDDLAEWEYDLLNAEDDQQPDDESVDQLRLF